MGFLSPIASSQCSTIGWLTGWRPTRGLLLPSALTRSAAARMSSTALIAVLGSSRKRSSRHPRHLEARRCNHFSHHLVHTAAKRDHQIPLGLAVEPPEESGRILFRRIPVLSDDLFRQPTRVLDPFGAKYFGCRGIGDVNGFARCCDLPVEQFVD